MKNENEEEEYSKFIYVVIGFIVLYILIKHVDIKSILLEIIECEKNLKNNGIIGIVVYVLLGILLNTFFFLYYFVNITTGYIFGFKNGLMISMAIVMITAIISFMISRNNIKGLNDESEIFKKIVEDQSDFTGYDWVKYNIITRLSPIPFNVVNLFWGITTIDINTYIIATLIGIIPWLLFEVYIGSRIKDIKKYL